MISNRSDVYYFGLTIDQWISVAQVVVPILVALLVGVAGAAWKFRRSRRGLRFSAEAERDAPVYAYRLAVSEAGVRSIASVAGWMKLTFFNNGSEPVSLAKVHAYEGGEASREPISPLFRKAELFHQTAEVGEPVRLPLRLDAKDGVVLWTLVEYALPAKLGEILFALEGDQDGFSRLEQQLEEIRAEVEKEVRQEIKYAEIVSIRIPGFSICDPIVHEDGGSTKIAPRFGFVPLGTPSNVLSYLVENRVEASPQQMEAARHYLVEIVTGEGRRLKHQFRTKRNAFWFFQRT